MKYMRHFLAALLLIAAGVVGCANQAEKKSLTFQPEDYFDVAWAADKFWDDGLAEVATYAAERVIYNQPRTFEYTQITVKEDFNKEYNVKTDDYKRKDLFPVMKVNQFCRIPSDNYPYHFLTSLFFRRENPWQVHKITSSSQEWCGNTFKAITQNQQNYRYTYNSYWDNQGTGEINLDKDIFFEDQLSYTLRSLRFKDGLSFKLKMAELIQTSKANQPTIYTATLMVNSIKSNSNQNIWQVKVNLTDTKQNIYWFAPTYPNILVQQQTWDGRRLLLKEVKRYAYWQH